AYSPPPPPAAALDPVTTLGTPVRDGKFEFVVESFESGLSSVGDNPFLTEEATGQFVTVTMTVMNTHTAAQFFSPDDQVLLDATGREFSPDPTAALNFDSQLGAWGEELNPGNTATVTLIYDIPVDATPTGIELHDSMFSGGTVVQLR
ncbi:DUF4352 domain-containing protein, partial [Rhodococcus sp. 7Tela_A2]|uniref:DUF4352 domain-containing protein n=1 Tax=Rhodococcus sp. 7Tela_A2 TaxID=3093744 RepID=UPI003BB7592E